MKSLLLILLSVFFSLSAYNQEHTELSLSDIMQGYDWVGYSPENITWDEHGEQIFYKRNPQSRYTDTLYAYQVQNDTTKRISPAQYLDGVQPGGNYNSDFTKKVYAHFGDIYLYDIPKRKIIQVFETAENESNPYFTGNDEKIVFSKNNNIFTWEITSGKIRQITDFKSGKASGQKKSPNKQQQWLKDDQLALFEVLKQKHVKKEEEKKYKEKLRAEGAKTIRTGSFRVINPKLSPDERYAVFHLYKKTNTGKIAEVPDYVTESGYTENISTRTKVGDESFEFKTGIYDIRKDTIYYIDKEQIPGVKQKPEFYADYPDKDLPEIGNRAGWVHGPYWSDKGEDCVIEIRSSDNKDRWIMKLELSDGSLELIDRQRDEAWIAGPGIGWYGLAKGNMGWTADDRYFWFISEESGYAHLYLYDMKKDKKKALTSGNYEVSKVRMSRDKKHWYFLANQKHPGERELFKLSINEKKPKPLTRLSGIGDYWLSPDEKMIAVRNSASNTPWELYLAENKPGAYARQISESQTSAFKSYSWRSPQIITFKARDGKDVYSRLYTPNESVKNNAAVVFVHGAGYLQNAHKWWSNYYREYMFHNFLVDEGYTVLDIDYRGSAGYGREWRTGIYRRMGGKDLTDQTDGAKYLIENHGIDPEKIGIYGGSYGGFISIMALFTQNETFKAGAAIRSVTDWAHYNHYYTSNILNEPHTDSLAYRRSSPVYHARKFNRGHLLILHGMVDTNVHFQDVVRLTQKLIELGKENWDMAVYPIESHGFKESSSWTDEYKRIFKFFETHLQSD